MLHAAHAPATVEGALAPAPSLHALHHHELTSAPSPSPSSATTTTPSATPSGMTMAGVLDQSTDQSSPRPTPMALTATATVTVSTPTSPASQTPSVMSPSTMSRLSGLHYAIAQQRSDLRLPSFTRTDLSLNSDVAASPSAAANATTATPALQLSMSQCETPHYMPGVPMCPETSPTEKKASKMDSNASSPVASSSTKHSSQQNHKHTHSSVSASSLKNRKKGTRRGTLNPEAKNVLKAWMFSPEHFAHPYPSEEEKEELACEAGIEVKQLSNWFTNARKRLWQPVLRQSGVEVKNFLSTGRGGPRGNKLDVPPNLQHLVAPKDSPPQSPMRVSDADEALNSPLKRPWSELQQSTSPAVSSTTEEASQPSKKKKSSSSRKRHKEERKQPTAGTAALTKTATQLSQELRLALAEKQASAASSPLASPPRSSSSSASTFQDLEILAATSLLGLHQQYQTAH